MMVQSIVLVVALFISVPYYCSAAENVYCVTPSGTSCSSCPHNSIHCGTLSEYAQEVETYLTSNTTMVFLSGVHALHTNITVAANIARLTMRGKSSSGKLPTVDCNGPVGFSFTSIVDLKIHSLAFTSCSRTYTIPLDDISSFLAWQYTLLYKRSPPSVHFKYALLLQSIRYAELVNCSFHDNLGTALVVNRTNITLAGNSNFTHNHCAESNSCAGGGGIAAFSSILTFTGNTTFFENNAIVYGAGIFMFNSSLNSTGSIHFINNLNHATLQLFPPGGTVWAEASSLRFNGTNNFINNSARSDVGGVGGAIYAVSTSLRFTGVSNFEQNSAFGGVGGAIYATGYSALHFSGTSNFSSNYAINGGAIFSILNTTMTFDGIASFTDNGHDIRGTVARYGGGIVLAHTSTFSVLPNTTVYWVNNHARLGGAISVWDMDVDGSFDTTYCTQLDTCRPRIKCFFQLPGQNLSNGLNVQLVFRNNSADNAGSVLYGGAIDHCKLIGLDSYNSGEVFDMIVHIEDDNTNSTISSSPFHVCLCENNVPNCSKPHVPRTVYPGETFQVSVIAYGQRNGTVAAAIRSHIHIPFSTLYNNIVIEGGGLQGFQYLQQANNTCTTLNYTVFSRPRYRPSLVLYADGPCSTFGKKLTFELTIKNTCLPGFNLSESASACVCEPRLAKYTNSCNITNGLGRITRHANQHFWVGYNNQSNGIILHPYCPSHYCVSRMVVFPFHDTDKQCAYNRSGLLCGACKEGYSLVLGTSHCRQCTNSYIALLIPFALMGVALVFFLLVCKLTVATGALSGLVFYANIVGVNHSTFLPVESTGLFIAWLNLDFGIETCFYDGMDAYGKTWLQFVFPVYIWVLVVLMIVVSRYSQRFANLLGNNPVSVLATLILLSYTKILRTWIAVIHFTCLEYPEERENKVWLYDANIDYLGEKHSPLFVVTMVVFLFPFLPYTLILLFGQWLPVISHLRFFSWVNKLKPFMDSYHAPYKAKHRYWPGLLLVLRFVLFLVFAFSPQEDPSINLLAILVGAVILQLWVLISGGVYTNWYLDVLEGSFALNLIILVGATLYHSGGNRLAAWYTSVSIAFVTFIGILAYHIFQQLRHTKLWKKVPKLNLEFNKVSIKQTLNAVNPIVHLWEEKQKPNDQEHKREETSNTNVTHTEVDLCELRSPLDMLDTK